MLNLKKFAVTGGLSSGKSTVCKIFESFGGYLVDADAIVHRLYSSSSICKQKVVDLLGQTVLTKNQLDRKKIAKHVFSHPELLKALEAIVHPLLFTEIEKKLSLVEKDGASQFAVVEIPLLFEVGCEGNYDVTVCVVSSEDVAKKRWLESGHDEEEYMKRMSRQMPIEEKAKRADYCITNNGDINELKRQIEKIITKTFGS